MWPRHTTKWFWSLKPSCRDAAIMTHVQLHVFPLYMSVFSRIRLMDSYSGEVWWFHFVVNDSRRIWPGSGVSTCCGASFQFRICCKVSYESFDRPNNFQGSPLVHVQDIRYASQIIPTFPEYSNVKKHEKAMHTENSWAGCVSSGHLRKLLVMNLVPKS